MRALPSGPEERVLEREGDTVPEELGIARRGIGHALARNREGRQETFESCRAQIRPTRLAAEHRASLRRDCA